MKNMPFDCVEMKHQIQQALRKRFANVTWSERNSLIRDVMSNDPHLSRLLHAGSESEETERGES